MFKPTSICLSALSKRTKRVKVQILKDFPQFLLYRGEVAQVKPSLMRNYLHNYNGARYILQDNDIDLELMKSFEQRQEELRSAKSESKTKEDAVHTADTTPDKSSTQSPAQTTAPQSQQQEPEKPKGVLEKDITVKDIKIPGLDL
ncbi:hypothetical protein ZYGR_0N03630 [Zygosaccharomyces rouxii]|uniref:ZYRO0D08646p n=2 Tax=Zygosaccharomyces rouxii TaxID=4956 RepID=C5DVQ7_ZYGRC|nr:uncharacterized protein ZYRO0D08646g [Zygosaccharomyces rouxii]KAH9200788.1 mitochondrial 54S ribosomal protein L50 [Zygosaccharomyces rouxii]CAQ43293.1 Mitochondrial 54S ribosomal protein L50 [Zygosaccharomyces rouxii]CAQ43581.1 Mitochondrial 54S ribosomal protein L50 [Zygosaccharomyces rouxii]CAR27876.1 ZYRO0D08646p [Zygosaccharomyces rouxii]GAV48958.1 hypothetical protein ZYGR_0N03630 [Zygosaccharomyces rouxii]